MKIGNISFAAVLSLLILITGTTGCKRVITISESISNSESNSSSVDASNGDSGKIESSAVKSGNNSTASTKSTQKSGSVRTPSSRASKDELVIEGAGKDPYANYKVKGTVTVAVSSYRPTDYEAMFDAFSSVYPNVDIILDYRPRHGGDNEECNYYLSTRALAGNMPDVVFDDAGEIPSYLTQGWVYPLDEFVKNDGNFKNVSASLIEDYTYGGKLYALPHQAHFSAVVLNKDAMDELNMDIPPLSWNMDQFEAFLKAGTTSKFSGLEYLGSLDIYTASAYNKNASSFGYNMRTRKFEMSGSYSSALKFTRKLKSYPGLEAYQLRFTKSGSGVSDYESKFGKGNMSVVDMAFKLGRTLVHLDQGTWAIDNLNSICKFDWTLFPYPQSKDDPGRIPIHVDHCFMTSATKNPDAAFQVLRYMTYSTEGNLARLSMYDSKNKGKYALNSRLYYPTTAQPDVAKKFKSLPGVTSIDKYFYDNIGKGYRVDLIKLVPGWSETIQAIGKSLEGKDNVDVDSLVNSLNTQGNNLISQHWSNFDSKLKSIQASFEKAHK